MVKKPKIIAEIASCHNGDVELGKEMVRQASKTGVDIVKFQSWQSKNVEASDADRERYESLELSDADHYTLKEECQKNHVEFLTTCYDEDRIDFLKELGLEKIKIASTDLKHFNFLKKIRENFKEVIVSTGMSTEAEIKQALDILKTGKFTIMHCVSIYPCPLEKANLGKLLWLKTLTPHVGYSDHTIDEKAAVLTMGMGVEYIEKHFTLDREMEQVAHTVGKGLKPITTHSIASEPEVFAKICQWRDDYMQAVGDGHLNLSPEEELTREKYTGRLGKNN